MGKIPYDRVRGTNWTLNGDKKPDGGYVVQEGNARLAVLMDIREELQTLNRLLHCRNFTGMPADLRQINKRLAQKVKLPRGRS